MIWRECCGETKKIEGGPFVPGGGGVYKGRGESKARVTESRQQGVKQEMRIRMRADAWERAKCEQKLEGVKDTEDQSHRKELSAALTIQNSGKRAGMQGSDYSQDCRVPGSSPASALTQP